MKIYFGILTLIIFIFSACQKETKRTLPENEILDKLTFVDYQAKKASSGIIVEFDLARPSRGCRSGLGFCNITWFPHMQKKSLDVNNNDGSYTTDILFDKKLEQYYIEIQLARPLPQEISPDQITFDIEKIEHLDLQKIELTLPVDTHFFDSKIGKFGGWRFYFK